MVAGLCWVLVPPMCWTHFSAQTNERFRISGVYPPTLADVLVPSISCQTSSIPLENLVDKHRRGTDEHAVDHPGGSTH